MKIIVLSSLLFSLAAFAEEAAHHAEGLHEAIEIPLATIGWQAVNLGILFIILFFALRKSVVESFANRRTSFLNQAEKTKAALKNAELALAEIKSKLSSLESGETKALENARHEANLIKTHIIHDSEVASAKMKTDLQQTLNNELEKAKNEINNLILSKAIGSVTKKITDKSSQVSQGAEASFLNQISQVNS